MKLKGPIFFTLLSGSQIATTSVSFLAGDSSGCTVVLVTYNPIS